MSPGFSDADDEKLVDEVGKHPPLWQFAHPVYKSQKAKEEIWFEISCRVGKPIELCKKRWRNIKDTFDRREHRAPPVRKGKPWFLEKRLTFLNKRTNEHQSSWAQSHNTDSDLLLTTTLSLSPSPEHCKIEAEELSNSIDENISSFENSETEPNPTNNDQRLAEDTEDDVDLFFKSLAKTVKKLSPQLQQRAKIETLCIINKLEAETWNLPSSSNALPFTPVLIFDVKQ